MMRWSYIGSRLALLAVIWAFFAFAFDPLLKRGMEKAFSSALGAQVDIAGVRTHLFPPSMLLRGVAAADPDDPMRNLVEFASCRFSLEGRPLLEKKVAISSAQLDGLRWGTARTRSGALPKLPPSAAAQKLKSWTQSHAKMPELGGKLGEIQSKKIDPKSLSSSKMADELEARWKTQLDAWEAKASTAAAAADIQEIERLFNQAKGSGSIPDRLKAAGELSKRVQALRQKGSSLRKDLDAELAGMRSGLDAVRKAKEGDFRELSARLGLPSFDQESLTAYLLGPKAAGMVSKALGMVRASRQTMSSKKKAPLQAARGMTVPFPRERSWPAYWLKEMKLSGEGDLGGPLAFAGTARDFSTEPALVGRPATLSLSGEKDRRAFTLEASLDHASATPTDGLRLTFKGMPIAEFTAGDPAAFALQATAGVAVVDAEVAVKGEALSGKMTLREEGVRLSAASAGSDPLIAKALAAACDGISGIELEVVLGGTLDDPQLKLSSNLGRAAADGLRKAVGAEAQSQLKAVQAQLDAALGTRTAGLEGLLKGRGAGLQERLGLNDKKLQELEDRLGKELKLPVKLPFDKLFR